MAGAPGGSASRSAGDCAPGTAGAAKTVVGVAVGPRLGVATVVAIVVMVRSLKEMGKLQP